MNTVQDPTLPSNAAISGFVELGVPQAVADVLTARGISSPFPIQTATLPDSLAGRDVLGRGRTGSGKTIAFALPVVTRLATSRKPRKSGSPRALILVPTRELATQVMESLAPLATSLGLKSMTIFGGVGQNPQVSALRSGIDICIATPGRLEDLIAQKACRLDTVEISVLDEADHMADLGFLPVVKRLLDATPRDTQRLLFSATLDRGVDVLVKRYLTDPVTHSVDTASSPVPEMIHHVFNVASDHKTAVVRELVSGQGRTVAFTRTKHAAKKLAKQLTASGIPAVDLHGNLSQNARQRNLTAFGEGSVRVLVATDIAARGIHVDDVSLVVHVDPPAEHKAYLHRSGRTARAGAEGVVVTVGTPSQTGDIRQLMRQAAIKPKLHAVEPGHPMITEITGPAAEHVAPKPEDLAATRSSGQGQPRRGGQGQRRRSNGPAQGGPSQGRSQGGRSQGGRSQGGRGSAKPAGSGRARSEARSGSRPASGGAAGFSAGRRRSR